MSAGPSAKATGRPAFWRRWILDPVMTQLTQGVTPHKVSLSIAVGSSLALFPVLGTTTALCVAAGIALRLNQPILQAINALCYPVYFPLIVVFVRIGERVTGSPASGLNLPSMLSAFSHHPADFIRGSGAIVLHAVLGWSVVAPLWVPLVYLLLLAPVRAAAGRMAPART